MKTTSGNAAIAVLATFAAFVLAGCNGLVQTAPTPVTGRSFSGRALGGQQPISGATIQLYAAGSTGYGSAATYSSGTSLLGANVVMTDANGHFSITGDYTCPSASTPVYIVGTGGNPGLGPGGNNPALAIMAALGPCGSLTSSTFITINELTTVGSVWALSSFMTGIANIGTSSTNALGLTNAFASVNKVVNIGTGTVSGPALPAGATLPIAKINTLADALAACVNSNGATTPGAACGTLFTAATAGGVAPTDTITAAMNIAQHPNVQTSAIAGMATPSAPFQPTLSSTPNDFSIVITHTGGGLSTPTGIATDTAGNVWLSNSGNSSVTKLDNTGAAQSGANGFTVGSVNVPTAIAIDQSGNAWVTNGNSTVTQLNSSGTIGTTYSGGALNTPASIAIDATGSAWVSNTGNNSVTQITSGGVLSNYTGAGITTPAAIAINPK